MATIAQADIGSANSVSAGSLIIALHARYEAARAEYNEIDTAQPAKPKDVNHPDWTLHWRLEEAMTENREETDALQQAILHQIPDTDEELAVLAYHAGSVFDPATTLTEAEKTALDRGLVSILDYLVS